MLSVVSSGLLVGSSLKTSRVVGEGLLPLLAKVEAAQNLVNIGRVGVDGRLPNNAVRVTGCAVGSGFLGSWRVVTRAAACYFSLVSVVVHVEFDTCGGGARGRSAHPAGRPHGHQLCVGQPRAETPGRSSREHPSRAWMAVGGPLVRAGGVQADPRTRGAYNDCSALAAADGVLALVTGKRLIDVPRPSSSVVRPCTGISFASASVGDGVLRGLARRFTEDPLA